MPVRTEPGYSIEQAENDIGQLRGSHDALNEYAEFTTAVVGVGGVIVAANPTNTNSLASNGTPMTQETWHNFNPLSSSWSVPSGGFAKYRLTTANELQISAIIQAPALSVNAMTIATFPVGYRNANASTHGFPVAASVALSNASNPNAYMLVDGTGNLTSQGIGANSFVYIEVKLPLDI